MAYVERLDDWELQCLPKGNGASEAIQHEGGTCPVHPLQPISLWWFNEYSGNSWWAPINTARQHDWSKPCVYRTRTPPNGHPMKRERFAPPPPPERIDPLDKIALDFERLVDAVENFLARHP